MSSCSPGIERAKPLLGTTVRVRVHGLEPERAHKAIDAAFAEILAVHTAMSFHEENSELSRLNREAHQAPVEVSNALYAVIARSQTISAATNGTFDITVAPILVRRGHLPRPHRAPEPHNAADWQDIELLPGNCIRFHRPLWIDLGGIAKGYAVDRATDALLTFAPAQACVNAGGDLRIMGVRAERVRLDPGHESADTIPVIELAEGSLASSTSCHSGPHIDPWRAEATGRLFASVTAPHCMDADALTKVVMARGMDSTQALATFGANAVLFDDAFGWQEIRGHVQ